MLEFLLAYLDDEDDKRLLENIFYSHRKQMVTLALSIVQNETDAEDIVSTVFLRVATRTWDCVRNIKNETDLRNYLLKATQNTAFNFLKRKEQYNLSLNSDMDYQEHNVATVTDDTFVERICEKAEYDQVVSAIRSLDGKYRDALYYHFVLEMTIPRTALLLDQTTAATKKQVNRGKKLLLAILNI